MGKKFLKLSKILLYDKYKYTLGLESFNGKDFKEAITHFDAAVKEFYDSESGCRAMCEGEYDGGKEYLNTYTSFHIQTVGE